MAHKTGLEDYYITKNNKKLRFGYTTGSCAAAAAKGAAEILLGGKMIREISLMTPKGILLNLELLDIQKEENAVTCAVQKDAGDDPDTTNGILVYATVEKLDGEAIEPRIVIDGGAGVGRVTKPGLKQAVGEAAINPVPKAMILRSAEEAADRFDYEGRLKIIISVPEGEKIAGKTFNPRLGIVGGISILGTTGIVEPMSEEALVETIRTHLNVLKAEGRKWVIAVPGNMGAGFLERYLVEHGKFCTDAHQGSNAADTDAAVEAEQMAYGELSTGTEPSLLEGFMNSLVTMSNFVGKTIDLAAELGFSGILIAGHMGKLVKIGNGIMNTHSREADGRMDTMLSCALSAGTEDLELLRKIQRSNTTDEAMDHLKQAGIIEDTINVFLKRADWHLTHRSRDEVRTGMIVFGTKGEYLGETEGVDAILRSALKELDQ